MFRYAIININVRPAFILAVALEFLRKALVVGVGHSHGVAMFTIRFGIRVAIGAAVRVQPLVAAGVKWWPFGAACGLGGWLSRSFDLCLIT